MTSIDINPQFALAQQKIETLGIPLMVSGKAGTGKSTLLKHIVENSEKPPVILASTGVAAVNIGGQTIHRFFGFSRDVTPASVAASGRQPRDPLLYKGLNTIIIDEISMVRADLMDCVDAFLRKHGPITGMPFGGVRMVFVGDLYQLPPVLTNNDKPSYYSDYNTVHFFGSKVLQETGVELVELQKVYRQTDQEFVDILNRVRDNTVSDQDMSKLNERLDTSYEPGDQDLTMYLTTTNKAAEVINNERLARLTTPECVSYGQIWGNVNTSDMPAAENLSFKLGAQIMMVNNDSEDRWVNGSVGVIEQISADNSSVGVRLQDQTDSIWVTPHEWKVIKFVSQGGMVVAKEVGGFTQLPFRLAWAVTIHKSQGKTFGRVVIDLGRGAFAAGQTYVALSRCTTFEGITLRTRIQRNSVIADSSVTSFLENCRKA